MALIDDTSIFLKFLWLTLQAIKADEYLISLGYRQNSYLCPKNKQSQVGHFFVMCNFNYLLLDHILCTSFLNSTSKMASPESISTGPEYLFKHQISLFKEATLNLAGILREHNNF